MPLFLVFDTFDHKEAGRQLVRKTLKRLFKAFPSESVALLDAAEDAAAVESESGAEWVAQLGAGNEHLASVVAKLDDGDRWSQHEPNDDTWRRLLAAVSRTIAQQDDAAALEGNRVLLVTDRIKPEPQLPPPSLLSHRKGRHSCCTLHVAFLEPPGHSTSHGRCEILNDLAAATNGTYTAYAVEASGAGDDQALLPLGRKKRQRVDSAPGHAAPAAALFQFRKTAPADASSRRVVEPVAVPVHAAVHRLAEVLSSTQQAELLLGHVSADVRLWPPFPPELCSHRTPSAAEKAGAAETSTDKKPSADGRDKAHHGAGSSVPKAAAAPVLQLSFLACVPSSAIMHPLVTSTHVMAPPASANKDLQHSNALLQLLTIILGGVPRSEPVIGLVGLRGETAQGSNVETLAMLQAEARGPSDEPREGGTALVLSVLHPAVHSFTWLEQLPCREPPPSKVIIEDVVGALSSNLQKAQRYANSLPSRQQALEEATAKIKGMASTYGAPSICEALGGVLQRAVEETEEKAAAEQKQRRQHNTRKKAAAHGTGSSQALETLYRLLDELREPLHQESG